MVVGSIGADATAVKVDNGGGSEGIEFAGGGAHGGKQDHGDQQADDPRREHVDDKVDEDIIGFFGFFRLWITVVDQEACAFAEGLGVLGALLEGLFGGLNVCGVAALTGFDEGICGRFLFGKGEVVAALEVGQLGGVWGVLEATKGGGVEEDRWFHEEVEDEDKDADVQDSELHGDLE